MVEPRVYTPAQLQELGELQEASDAGRLTQQQYNGWAPGTSDDEGDSQTERLERLDRRSGPQSSAALLDEQVMRRDELIRERMRLRRWRDTPQSEWRDFLLNDSTTLTSSPWGSHRSSENREESVPTVTESSLRTTALLQAVRRNPQFSTRSRNELQRYILDRERGDDRDRTMSGRAENSSNTALSPSQRRQIQREATTREEIQQHRDLLAEHQQHRNYLEEQLRQQRNGLISPSENRRRRLWQTPSLCMEKRRIDDVIKYLGKLRLCETEEEGQETAEDGGFSPKASSEDRPDDFLIDTRLVPPPPESSWLKPGGVLSGTQYGSTHPSYTSHMPPTISRQRTRNPRFGSVPTHASSSTRQSPDSTSQSPTPHISKECWPVKVTMHSVDYNTMTLTGTMEAFDVPDNSSPTQSSSITTFLEGEIIDFNKFSLETNTFKANAWVDGTHWGKLPPFKDVGDEEVVKRLLSRGWLGELMEKWILMRWKGWPHIFPSPACALSVLKGPLLSEKCFVTPSDAQTALTINGFYYVSLRREDGHVQGLYYDENSTPYQHIALVPERRTFPTYTFQ